MYREHLTWQLKDLSQGQAVVERCRDDTLCPGSLRDQLVHLLAGVQTVFAHRHPVICGCGDHDADPAKGAEEKSTQLDTRVRHVCINHACPKFRNCSKIQTLKQKEQKKSDLQLIFY